MRRRIYNPAQLKREELKGSFIARQKLLDSLLKSIAGQKKDAPPQHLIFIGQRGMGKTTLGLRLLVAIEEDEALARDWQPVAFHEESYGINDLADFWLTALHHLAAATGEAQWAARADKMEKKEKDAERLAAYALDALHDFHAETGKRLLLFVENLDTLFKQFRHADEIHHMRKALMTGREIMLIGTANAVFGQIQKHGQPLYEFFRQIHLTGLDKEETARLLSAIADQEGDKNIRRILERDPGRIETIRQFTDGNPRMLILTYGLLTKSPLGSAREDLEKLIDEQTPYFKARIEELPPQARRVFHSLAEGWAPLLAREVGEACRISSSKASAQLKQLSTLGYVREVKLPRAKKMRYQLSERFYNIYYILRFSRTNRQRLEHLIEFLRSLYGQENMGVLYRSTLDNLRTDEDMAGEGPLLLNLLLERVSEDISPEEGSKWLRDALSVSLDKEMDAEAEKALEQMKVQYETDIITAEDYEKGLVDYLAQNPGALFPSINLAVLLFKKNEFERALADVLESLALQYPDEPLVMMITSNARQQIGDLAGANDAINAILEKKVESAVQAYSIGVQLESLNRYEESEIFHKKALELDPKFESPVKQLAKIFSEQERYDELESLLEKYLEKFSEDAEGWRILGYSLLRQEKTDLAIGSFEKALELSPEKSLLWVLVGVLYLSLGKLDLANTVIKRSIKLDPKTSKGWTPYSLILLAKNFRFAGIVALRNAFSHRTEEDLKIGFEMVLDTLSAFAASGLEEKIKELLESADLVGTFEPFYHAIRRRLGEELEPLPAEIMEAVDEVEKLIEKIKKALPSRGINKLAG